MLKLAVFWSESSCAKIYFAKTKSCCNSICNQETVSYLDYQKILEQLASGELEQYQVKPEEAFAFQAALRQFGKRQNISGKALRGGEIIYTQSKNEL